MQALRLSSQIQEDMSHALGLTVCHSNEIVQSHFSDGVLIVWYINKMGTTGGGGVVGYHAATIASHFGPGLKSQPGCKSFFH